MRYESYITIFKEKRGLNERGNRFCTTFLDLLQTCSPQLYEQIYKKYSSAYFWEVFTMKLLENSTILSNHIQQLQVAVKLSSRISPEWKNRFRTVTTTALSTFF